LIRDCLVNLTVVSPVVLCPILSEEWRRDRQRQRWKRRWRR